MIDIDPLPIAAPGTTPGQSPGDSAAFASALDDATTAADAQVADDTATEPVEDTEGDPSNGTTLELAFTAALAPTLAAEAGQQPTPTDGAVVSSEAAELDPELAVVADAGPEVATDASVEPAMPNVAIDHPEVLAEAAAASADTPVAAPMAAAIDGGEIVEPMLDPSDPAPEGGGDAVVDVDLTTPASALPSPLPTAESSPQGDTAGDESPAAAAMPVASPAPAGGERADQSESAPAPVPTVASSEAAVVAEAPATEAAAPAPPATPAPAARVDTTAPAMNAAALVEPTPPPAADTAVAAEMPTAPPATADLDAPPPAQQLAEALRDVRRMSDGSHRLSLQLHPEELGAVQLEVAVRDGQLHLRAVAETDSTRRLLTASIPELREQLTDAGVSAGSLEVGAESAADHQRADAGDDGSTPHANAPEGEAEGPTAQPTTSLRLDAGQLDVQL